MDQYPCATKFFGLELELLANKLSAIAKTVLLDILTASKSEDRASFAPPRLWAEEASEINMLVRAIGHSLLYHERAIVIKMSRDLDRNITPPDDDVAIDAKRVWPIDTELKVEANLLASTTGIGWKIDAERDL